jgi:hypothetical protein
MGHVIIIGAVARRISLPWYLTPGGERVRLLACDDWLPRAPLRPPVRLYRGRNPGDRVCGSGRVGGER